MKEMALSYLVLIVLLIGLLHTYDKLHNRHLTFERAMSPVRHLSNARQSIMENNFNSSIKSIESAILDMRIIEQYADSSAVYLIDRAIEDLKVVEAEIQNDSVLVTDLNKAYFNALNSIAFANLTIAEASLDKGERYKAMRFLNATFKEMVTSLSFAADDESRAKETKVIEDIKTILTELHRTDYQYQFDYDSINKELEELISQ